MGNRTTKKELQALGPLIALGAIGVGIAKFFEIFGFVIPIVFVALLIWWYTRSQSKKRQLRLEYLRNKYKDDALVQKIVAGYFWKGQTANQLIDSLGQPADVDQKVLKSMKREIWKYRPQSRTRYGLRITLENDVVVGWDQKD